MITGKKSSGKQASRSDRLRAFLAAQREEAKRAERRRRLLTWGGAAAILAVVVALLASGGDGTSPSTQSTAPVVGSDPHTVLAFEDALYGGGATWTPTS